MGPEVSWLDAIGMIPVRLARPTVGLTPASEFALAGLRIDPEVSVPMVAAAKLAAAAAPGPALDPPGVRIGRPSGDCGSGRGSYGLKTKSPTDPYPARTPRVS